MAIVKIRGPAATSMTFVLVCRLARDRRRAFVLLEELLSMIALPLLDSLQRSLVLKPCETIDAIRSEMDSEATLGIIL